ncbi:MAG: signal peptidase I [Candidatus Aenigmarchaeota archaeon]|nr:signal peptidase I [Candidatus Aenigmarchaeota archaeon]
MNKSIIAILMIAAFALGYLAANPSVLSAPTEVIAANLDGKAIERISPQDHIKENQILVTSDKITLNIKDASWSTFTDTNSMDPVLDQGSNGIEVAPASINDVKVGDIISYRSKYGLIIHRVVKTGFDEQDWYALVKGDNNPVNDPDKVRFDQIHGVLVAIIY